MERQTVARTRTRERGQVLGHVFLATTAILWGSSYISTRVLVGEVPPLLLGLLRGLLGTLVVGAAAWWTGERLHVRLRSWLPIAGLGALGVGYFYLGLNLALQWTSATAASLLSLPYPALTALGGWLFLKERVRPVQAAGIGLAAAGATWLTLATAQEGLGGAWVGNLLALSITVAWTIYTLLGRRLLPHWPALTATFHMMLAGTLLLALGASAEFLRGARPVWTVETVLMTLYLGAICTGLGYAFWNRGLSLVPAAAASTYLYLQPVTVLALAIPLLGERPSWGTIAAGVLVIAGTALAARRAGGD